MSDPRFTAFSGEVLLARGAISEVVLAVRAAQAEDPDAEILIFEDSDGRVQLLDLTRDDGGYFDAPARPSSPATKPSRGRPKLGVVAKEVTLLPRHWEWLATQPGGASGTLRRLVDAARKQSGDVDRIRNAQAAADRFMQLMAGDRPGYEDASRALYARDKAGFEARSAGWPADIRDYARSLAAPAFEG
ncbi:DUF2239 family protein [Cucumibacter marinus]|uniref:DUF2239 family protein n=1 Tax=Cucumibacter marinus TaxID=1121252 RepID=UPI00041994BC|nr:DUF2239 family protein [Cucumibacter marinus]